MRYTAIFYSGRLWWAYAIGAVLGIVLTVLAHTASAQTPQPTPCLNADDVKAFRQALADRDFYKQRAENAEAMNTAITASRDSWKALYEAEKVRADTVQGGRIDALQAALDVAKAQMADDRQKIGEQNAEIIRLKSGQKWWFAVGAGVGGVAGYFIGANIDKATTILLPQQNRLGFKVRF